MKTKIFDQIYLVNLLQHRGQRLKALSHLRSFGITPMVFDASDGYLPPILDRYETYSRKKPGSLSYFTSFNKLEAKRNKRFVESAGAFGYIDTYIRILDDAKTKGYQSILILEDDVLLASNFNKSLESFFKNLPDTWKFVGLGASQYNWESVDFKKSKSKGYYTPKQLDTCGSFAIAIRETVFDELIELQSHYEAPFDHLPLGEIYNKYPSDCFIAFPYMVMPDVRSSSIRGSRNQLIHAKKMRWDASLFEYPPVRPIINLILTSKEQIKYLASYNDDSTFPFELHLFITSLDGLRPYHDPLQSFEANDEKNIIYSPSAGYCVSAINNIPITEDDLISLYESLVTKNITTVGFKIVDTVMHNIDSDKVSVIIPTYRRAENLTSVLLSVIEQDYENKEIIVVDDNPQGSDEQVDTKCVVSSLIEKYPDIQIVYISHSRNRNGAAARNTGFLRSSGNYVCFLDDDDLYLPGRLSKSIDRLSVTPQCIGAVYCGFTGWNGAINTKERYEKSNLTEELLSLNYLSHFLHTNTATYKREAIVTINGFDESFRRHQDLEFNLRFFEYYEMSVVQEALVSLRPEPTTINNQQFGINLFETKLKFLKKFEYIINRFDYADRKNIYDSHWKEVVNYASKVKLFEKYLLSNFSNGFLQCYRRLEVESKVEPKVEPKAKLVSDESDLLLEPSKEFYIRPNNESLKSWQKKGANTFGVVFDKFILPPQRRKLTRDPQAFFEDSKNTFTRLVGKLLKII